jgi:hypothetical protein
MNRIKDKATVKMLEDILNYTDEEKKTLKENFGPMLKYSLEENITQQISEAIKNGRTNAKLFYAKVRSPTECSIESVFVEFEDQLVI